MRVAWFTPFNKKSAIGRYSKAASLALSRYADVNLFITDDKDSHETSLRKVIFKSDNVLSKLESYDICIYNMGDFAGYHSSIYEVMRKHRGLVISHDACLHNFFRSYYISCLQDTNGYINKLASMYGEDEANLILESANSVSAWLALDLNRYHMTELLYPFSSGFAVHSKYHASIIERAYAGPICTVPLLYENEWRDSANKKFNGYDTSKINLLVVGNINPNKRIHSIIEALGSKPEITKKFNLTCIGSLENNGYINLLREQVTDLKLEKNVSLLGFVEHDKLIDYYKNADILVNLRFPTYEGGSASIVEQMQLSKTVIVSDTGVYSEIPDDCVIKIDTQDEIEALKRLFLDIAKNPKRYKGYGDRAAAYAKKTHSPDVYGKILYEFIQEILFLEPLQKLTDLLGQELRAMSVTGDMQICQKISEEVELLYNHSV